MQRFDLNQNWEYLESSLQNPLMVGMLQGWKKTSLPRSLLPQELYRGTGNHRPALLAGI